MSGKMQIFRTVLIAVLAVLVSSCTTHYNPLGYVEFQGIDAMKARALRAGTALFLKDKCHLKESHEDSPDQARLTSHFTFSDFYDCDDNIYVSVSQMSVIISYRVGKDIGSQRWKALGQGIEKLALRVDPGLKMHWPDLGRYKRGFVSGQ